MIVREFLTRWGFQIEGQKLNRMESQLDSIRKRMDLMIGVRMAQGFARLAGQFSQTGERIAANAAAAGLGVEAFQRLGFAGQQSGLHMDQLAKATQNLSQRIFDFKKGGAEAMEAFKGFGFTPEQVNNFRDSEDALLQVADRFAQMEDPLLKSALAMKTFGDADSRLIALLSRGRAGIEGMGAEASRLGIILGQHQVQALERLQRTYNRVFATFTGVASRITADIAPAFEELAQGVLDLYLANRQLIEVNVRQFLLMAAYAMGVLWGAVQVLTEAFVKLLEVFGLEDRALAIAAGLGAVTLGLIALSAIVSFITPGLSAMFGVFRLAVPLLKLMPLLFAPIVLKAVALSVAIGAVVVGLHDLYALMAGKKQMLPGIISGAKNFLGFGGSGEQATGGVLEGFDQMRANALNGAAAGGNTSNSSVNVNSPITVNVPPGTEPSSVGGKVREGVADAMGRMLREAQRSLTPAVAY